MEGKKNLLTWLKAATLQLSQKLSGYIQHFRSKFPKGLKAIKLAAYSFIVMLLLGLVFVMSVYWGAFGKLPDYAELKNIRNSTASEVYSADGDILGKYFIENRVNASLEEIAPQLIDALIATEDARFFRHRGVDFRAYLRVFFRTVLLMDESGGGGSTISQQLAKNLYKRKSYGVLTIPVNKTKEVLTARRLERLYTKEELLNMYLNTVPFGGNIFGVKVASRRFFDKAPHELDVQEAALLVGMLKAPSYYNPVRHPQRAQGRRNTVLAQMDRYDYLENKELDSLQRLPLQLAPYSREDNNQGLATYFREHLRLELEDILADYRKPDGSRYNLYTDGLKIYTSIDARMQHYAEQAVEDHMPELQKQFYDNWGKRSPWPRDLLEDAVSKSDRYQQLKAAGASQEEMDSVFARPVNMTIFDWEKGEVEVRMSPIDSVRHYTALLHTGMMAVEPSSGRIKVWIGGIDHKYFQYDHVKSKRQVGSIFKPVVFAQALRNGMMPCQYTYNDRISYAEYNNWSPRNADGQYGGVYSMEGALSQSVNVVAVEMLLRGGIESVRKLAVDLGMEGPVPPVPAIGLGAVDASLMEMMKVYGTFANQGKRPILHYLDRIETSDGKIVVAFDQPGVESFPKVLSPEESNVMNEMLKGVVAGGTATALRTRYGVYNMAAKTGTAQDQSDGWFVGYSPDLVVGAWVGAESPKIHFRTLRAGQGSKTALPIVGSFLNKVYKAPAFKSITKARFSPPSDSMQMMMDCPPYLEEMPLVMEYLQDYEENPGFINRVYDELLPQFDIESIRMKRQRNRESQVEYIERMKAYNERLKRREARRRARQQQRNESDDGGFLFFN